VATNVWFLRNRDEWKLIARKESFFVALFFYEESPNGLSRESPEWAQAGHGPVFLVYRLVW